MGILNFPQLQIYATFSSFNFQEILSDFDLDLKMIVFTRSTFMWYHTDLNGRILESRGRNVETETTFELSSSDAKIPASLQSLSAKKIISSKVNFFAAANSVIPERIKHDLAVLCGQVEYILRLQILMSVTAGCQYSTIRMLFNVLCLFLTIGGYNKRD